MILFICDFTVLDLCEACDEDDECHGVSTVCVNDQCECIETHCVNSCGECEESQYKLSPINFIWNSLITLLVN